MWWYWLGIGVTCISIIIGLCRMWHFRKIKKEIKEELKTEVKAEVKKEEKEKN